MGASSSHPRALATDLALLATGSFALLVAIILWFDNAQGLLTGNGVSLNTSLNRRGEPMICSPTDALNMFFGSDLQYLIMEDILVVKEGADAYDTLG